MTGYAPSVSVYCGRMLFLRMSRTRARDMLFIRAPALQACAALRPGRVPRSTRYVHPHWRAFGVRQKFVTFLRNWHT